MVGSWDPLAERFATLPLLQIDGERFTVRADEQGESLRLEAVVGLGRLKLAIAAPADAEIKSLQATVAARDGSAFVAAGASPTIKLPPGDYRIAGLTVVVRAKGSGTSTRFVFTREFDAPDQFWHALTKDQELTFDPLGTLTFDAALIGAVDSRHFRIQPQLRSSEGLHIVTATTHEAVIELAVADGKRAGSATSGFA